MLRLAAVYGAHTVLQQGTPVAVFGGAQAPAEAAPGPICMVYFFPHAGAVLFGHRRHSLQPLSLLCR